MMAYLAMMAPRLIDLHRVLRVTGSIYLHCDPTLIAMRNRGPSTTEGYMTFCSRENG